VQDHFDVAIVDAGAAGLAAALRLRVAALDVVVLEARERVGGRAWTLHPAAGLPLDAGCGWLHSADENRLAGLIEGAGLVIDRTPPHWERQSGGQDFGADEQRAFREAHNAFEARLEMAAQTGRDAAGADFFEPGNRWNPLIDAISAYYNGAEFERVSVLDYAAYEDTGVNWRVRDGYGAGVAALASSLEPVLGCAVSRIDHGAAPIRLTTRLGTLTARAVIVTVPTPHLAHARIAFTPGLQTKVEAAANLPLGLADKAFLYLAEPEALPVEGHLFGRTDRTETGSYHLRPFGRPYIEVYLAGRNARMLEGEGPGAMIAFALEELAALMGSDFRRGLSPIAETAWAEDPWALGSYSHALPSHAGARGVLAAAVDQRLFFAGEATHPRFFSTAHGAWETGVRAAEEALAALLSSSSS
jgi:monoamine oxidase